MSRRRPTNPAAVRAAPARRGTIFLDVAPDTVADPKTITKRARRARNRAARATRQKGTR